MNDNNISDVLYEKRCALEEHVMRFSENEKQYKAPSYDEANTRVDFIDELFKVLDWDMNNSAGYAEQYREVVREDKVEISGKQKAPDYSFRIGRERKFFVLFEIIFERISENRSHISRKRLINIIFGDCISEFYIEIRDNIFTIF